MPSSAALDPTLHTPDPPMTEPARTSRIQAHRGDRGGVAEIAAALAADLVRTSPRTSSEGESAPLVWIDIIGPGEEEAVYLRERVQLHPLAVEDCLRGRQRPKLERFPSYAFIVFYAVHINPQRERMALTELHIFLGEDFLLTVHDQVVPELDEVRASWIEGKTGDHEVGTLAHALLDRITDNYFPVVEHFSDRLEVLEADVLEPLSEASVKQAAALRQELVLIRRVLAPQRDILSSLIRRDFPFLHPDAVPYFADVHDHTLRLTEEIDAFRELVAGVIEIHASTSANQLNRTMQTLTGWSIILMSIGVIAGIYGMNFLFMPELALRWGYPGALVLMLGVGMGLYSVFRRKGWL